MSIAEYCFAGFWQNLNPVGEFTGFATGDIFSGRYKYRLDAVDSDSSTTTGIYAMTGLNYQGYGLELMSKGYTFQTNQENVVVQVNVYNDYTNYDSVNIISILNTLTPSDPLFRLNSGNPVVLRLKDITGTAFTSDSIPDTILEISKFNERNIHVFGEVWQCDSACSWVSTEFTGEITSVFDCSTFPYGSPTPVPTPSPSPTPCYAYKKALNKPVCPEGFTPIGCDMCEKLATTVTLEPWSTYCSDLYDFPNGLNECRRYVLSEQICVEEDNEIPSLYFCSNKNFCVERYFADIIYDFVSICEMGSVNINGYCAFYRQAFQLPECLPGEDLQFKDSEWICRYPCSVPSSSPSQTSAVTPSQTSAVTPSQTSAVTPSQSSVVTSSPTSAVTPSQSSVVTSSPTSAVTPSQTSAVTPSQTSESTPSQTSESTPSQSSAVTPSQSSAVTSSPSSESTPSQTSAVTPSQSSAVTPSQTSAVTPSQSSAVTPSQTSAVTPSQTSAVAPSQTSAVTPSQSSAVTPSQSSVVTSSQSSAVTPSQSSAVTPSQSSAVTSSPSSESTPSQTSAVTPSQTSAVTPSQTSAVTSSQSSAVTPSQTSAVTSSPTLESTPSQSSAVTSSPTSESSPSQSSAVTSSPTSESSPSQSSVVTSSPTSAVTPSQSSVVTSLPTSESTPSQSSVVTSSPTSAVKPSQTSALIPSPTSESSPSQSSAVTSSQTSESTISEFKLFPILTPTLSPINVLNEKLINGQSLNGQLLGESQDYAAILSTPTSSSNPEFSILPILLGSIGGLILLVGVAVGFIIKKKKRTQQPRQLETHQIKKTHVPVRSFMIPVAAENPMHQAQVLSHLSESDSVENYLNDQKHCRFTYSPRVSESYTNSFTFEKSRQIMLERNVRNYSRIKKSMVPIQARESGNSVIEYDKRYHELYKLYKNCDK